VETLVTASGDTSNTRARKARRSLSPPRRHHYI